MAGLGSKSRTLILARFQLEQVHLHCGRDEMASSILRPNYQGIIGF